MSRAQGAGFSSRGVRDGASEGSGPSGLLGDPPHVEGRARVSTRVRGTASDGVGDGDGFPFPPSVETATRVRERVSPRKAGPRHRRGPASALRASAAGPDGASLTLRFSPQCSLPNFCIKMIRALRDM